MSEINGSSVCRRCLGTGRVPCLICGGAGSVEHPSGGVNYCPNSYDDSTGRPFHLLICPDDDCPECDGSMEATDSA